MTVKINFLTTALFWGAIILSGCSKTNEEAPKDGGEIEIPPPTEAISENYFPMTPSSSSVISRIQVENLRSDERLAVLSLQGIVNRDKAEIYTHGGPNLDQWMVDFYKNKGYIRSETVFTDPYALIEKYGSEIEGVVIFDPTKRFTINLAVNIAGVENCVVVSPEMADRVKSYISNARTIDIRTNNFEGEVDAWDWYFENVFPKQNHSALILGKGGLFMYEVYYDYAVAFKLPVFWLPGVRDSDYSVGVENRVRKLLSSTPDNIPVLGFWPGVEEGKDIGWEEANGVKLGGQYGKFTVVNTWVGNYSYHTGVKLSNSSFKQTLPRSKPMRKYDPTKKYVAMIMIESGDAPGYFLYGGFNPRQWNDPDRGSVEISYGITSSLRMLAPALLREIYNTQTENDFFFMSISGAGYIYPFVDFGGSTKNRDEVLRNYFSVLTQKNMEIMDYDMMGLHWVSGQAWSASEYSFANSYFSPIKGLKSVISGMHRIGNMTAGKAHRMLNNDVSVHHTVTFWATPGFQWDDLSRDDAAVSYLENEIKTYGTDGNFIQAMFLSWDYGPRRLKKLKTKLEREGYEFVTLNEFDYLWRASQK